MRQLFLRKYEGRRIRNGHLWVFSNEVDTDRSPLTGFSSGEAVAVHDAGGEFLGAGYVNPASLISARLMTHARNEAIDGVLIRKRMADALALRERLFRKPYYRLCHAEGDFLPGLVVDRFDDVISVQLNTAGVERLKDDILSVLGEMLHPRVIVLRNDTASRDLEHLPKVTECVLGTWPDEIVVSENGCSYVTPFKADAGGQKTGWFFDQRPNRAMVASLGGRNILDAFCYAGGFGVAAASAGAESVTFLDASETALRYARCNAEHMDRPPSIETVHGDALTELARLREAGRRYDVVCLDPPAFIKRKKDAKAGMSAYRRVNDLGVRLVGNGGILATCSCSHHLSMADLHGIISQSLVRHRCFGQLIHVGLQGPDHPVHPCMPETAYLKALAFRIRKDDE